MKKTKKPELRIENRKARFDYQLLDTWTAGMLLTGPEVKAIRDGRVNLADSFCWFVQDELWTNQLSINVEGASPHIKLLLHRRELDKIQRSLHDGLTLVVTRLFTFNGRIKAELALAKGKKNWDKRETIKARDIDRESRREN